MTALIILAAGLSTRFGTDNKLLADLSGKPLARYVVDALVPLAFSKKYVVTAGDEAGLSDVFSGYTKVINSRPEEGQWSSIRLGVTKALEEGHKRALICLADMPLTPTTHYAALFNCEISTMTSVNDVRQPPAFFDHKDLKALAMLKRGGQGKDVLLKRPETIALPAHLAVDIDHKADLVKLLKAKST